LCKDLLEAKEKLAKEEYEVAVMQDIKDKIERNIIGQIEKSRVEVRKLSNVLKAEILLKEA